ncbi:hypothetical protein RCH07_003554 [Arthrobacter sp. CG_A4]|nr:hypothetical protein [Arthrobacter sp. CG_A4]
MGEIVRSHESSRGPCPSSAIRDTQETIINTLDSDGSTTDPALLRFRPPLGWYYINLTGG